MSARTTYQPTNFQPGRVHQYNANVERQLPGNVLLTAGYAGSTGGHLLVIGNDLNTNSPSACGTISGYTLGCLPGGAPYIYPYNPPNFNAILLCGDVGKTHYNSLQIKAETKTPKYGLYALVAYTYSHTYDNGLSDGLGSELSAPYFPLPNWQNLDWSLSQINLNHSFTGSVIYDLPFGKGKRSAATGTPMTNTLLGDWQVTLIERVSSGFPVPLIDSFNTSRALPSIPAATTSTSTGPIRSPAATPTPPTTASISGSTRHVLFRRLPANSAMPPVSPSSGPISSTPTSRSSSNLPCPGAKWV